MNLIQQYSEIFALNQIAIEWLRGRLSVVCANEEISSCTHGRRGSQREHEGAELSSNHENFMSVGNGWSPPMSAEQLR